MTRRDVFGTLLAIFSIALASWVIGTYSWIAWVLLAGALLVVIVGGIIVIPDWTSRRRVVKPGRPLPRRLGTHPSTGSPVRTSRALGGRGRGLSSSRAGRAPSLSRWW